MQIVSFLGVLLAYTYIVIDAGLMLVGAVGGGYNWMKRDPSLDDRITCVAK